MKKIKNPADVNPLCHRCVNRCKQSEITKLVQCPNYEPRDVQMELHFKRPSSRTRKNETTEAFESES